VLNDYLNQGAALRRKTGTDDRGQLTHGPAQVIRCRRQKRGRLNMANQGAARVQETVYYTKAPVFEGDMLGGAIVTAVNEWVDRDGNVIGYKAVV